MHGTEQLMVTVEYMFSMSRAWQDCRGSFFTTTAPCVVLLDIAQHHPRKGNSLNFFESVD